MQRRMKKYMRLGICGLVMFCVLFAAPGAMREAKAGRGDVFQVMFPTDTEDVFDFIMDPQELIRMTDAAAYGGLSFEEGANLFFRRHDGRADVDYSSSSDALVIANIGTADVGIQVSAGISPDSLSKIVMTGDPAFEGDENASLYLALTDGVHTVPILEGQDAVIQVTLAGSDGADPPEEYRFWLVGSVNGNGDWSEVTGAIPKVTVTWSASTGEAAEPEGGEPAGEETSGESLPESREETSEAPSESGSGILPGTPVEETSAEKTSEEKMSAEETPSEEAAGETGEPETAGSSAEESRETLGESSTADKSDTGKDTESGAFREKSGIIG